MMTLDELSPRCFLESAVGAVGAGANPITDPDPDMAPATANLETLAALALVYFQKHIIKIQRNFLTISSHIPLIAGCSAYGPR